MSQPITYRDHVISTEVIEVTGFETRRFTCSVRVKDGAGKPVYIFSLGDSYVTPELAEEYGFAAGRWRIDEGLGPIAE